MGFPAHTPTPSGWDMGRFREEKQSKTIVKSKSDNLIPNGLVTWRKTTEPGGREPCSYFQLK